MTGSWLRLFAGATLTLSVAGHALADDAKITVFAAASLTNAMQDIAKEYKKEKNVEVVSSFASSSTLARQIEAGAPADPVQHVGVGPVVRPALPEMRPYCG